MASGFLRRAMIQLGLVDDDEYDDYEVYEDAHPVPAGVGRSRQGVDQLDPPSSQVRPVPRDFEGGGVTLQAQRPAVVRPVPMQSTRVHVVAPSIVPSHPTITLPIVWLASAPSRRSAALRPRQAGLVALTGHSVEPRTGSYVMVGPL